MAIALAPDLTVNQTPARWTRVRQNGISSMNPDDMKPAMLRTLVLLCHGYTNEQIARRTHYSRDTIKGRTEALFAVFGARNRAHLAAVAVAQGYVDMKLAVGGR